MRTRSEWPRSTNKSLSAVSNDAMIVKVLHTLLGHRWDTQLIVRTVDR